MSGAVRRVARPDESTCPRDGVTWPTVTTTYWRDSKEWSHRGVVLEVVAEEEEEEEEVVVVVVV